MPALKIIERVFLLKSLVMSVHEGWRHTFSDRGARASDRGLGWLKVHFSNVILPHFLRQEPKTFSDRGLDASSGDRSLL